MCYPYYDPNNQNDQNNQEQQKEWHETLWGLVILTVGLNVLSNFIYDKGRERIRLQDQARERRRNRRHLRDFHDKTEQQAKEAEELSNKQSYDKSE